MTNYKLVPVEPTEHMLDSGQCASFRDIETQDAVRIYEAMLAAAPAVQQPAPDATQLVEAASAALDEIEKAMLGIDPYEGD